MNHSELAGKYSMGQALGTHLSLGGGEGPDRQSLDPWDTWGLSCPVAFGPEIQSLSPRKESILSGERV